MAARNRKSKIRSVIKLANKLGLSVKMKTSDAMPDSPQSRFLDVHFDAASKVLYLKQDRGAYIGACHNLLHELGHWVVASNKERTKDNYGLRMSPFANNGRSYRQEVLACKAQFAIMEKLGYSEHYIHRLAVGQLYFEPKEVKPAIVEGRKLLKRIR